MEEEFWCPRCQMWTFGILVCFRCGNRRCKGPSKRAMFEVKLWLEGLR